MKDEVGRFLVDSHLSLNDSVVDQPDEGAETLVVVAGEVKYLVFEVSFLFLEHD